MGCSASKPITVVNTKYGEQQNRAISSPSNQSPNFSKSSPNPNPKPNPIPKAYSLSTPLVHHPPLRKGDTHHLVSLTSTTYGSLFIDPPKTPSFQPPNKPLIAEPDQAQKNSLFFSPDSVINTWELMDGLDDFDLIISSTHDRPMQLRTKPSSCRFTEKRPSNSYESARYDHSSSSFSPSSSSSSTTITKPLWQHLSEESILSKMDPNVGLTYRRALSSRQLNYNKHSKTRSLGSSPFACSSPSSSSFSFSYKPQLPGKAEDKIIIYFTSLRGIRKTYEDCCSVRMIFRGYGVSVDERDVSMDSEFRKELENALGGKGGSSLPRVFIRGKYIGGVEEIKQLNENGELGSLLKGFPSLEGGFVCSYGCGDARFLPCPSCNGSSKVFEEEEGELRRCLDCNENGLIRCPGCCS